MHDHLKEKVISGVFWRMLERFGTQFFGFVVAVILARLLGPKDFGTVALLSIFLALANVLIDSGFATSLVQKKNATEADFNSVFIFSLGLSLLLYTLLFFCAPWIAWFYDEPVLTTVLRWSALNLVLNAVNGIQNALIAREMRFKISFTASIGQTLVQGIVGISMAFLGYGLWSLVASSLAGNSVGVIVRWYLIGWNPKWSFSWDCIRQLFRFGSRMLLSGALDTFFNNVYGLIIGKFFSPVSLAYYNRGQSIPNIIMSSVTATLASVMFPALSHCQHDPDRMRNIVRRMIKTSCFFVVPSMVGLAVIAKPLTLILLTSKWLPSVPFLQLSCITFAFWPIHVANLQAITASGRSDIFLTLEVIKKVLILVVILISFPHGVMAMVIGQALLSPVCAVINGWPNRKLIGYDSWVQWRDVSGILLASTIMGVVAYCISWVVDNSYLLIVCQMSAGIFVYFLLVSRFSDDSVKYIRQNIKQLLAGGASLAKQDKLFV
jgi:O-antigen/teichoic acid export membrane protein